jgi:hypothetical protein
MSRRVEIPEEKLRNLYHTEGFTLGQIAERFDCSKGTVHNRMEEHDVERTGQGAPGNRKQVECAACGESKTVEPAYYEKYDRFFCDNDCQGNLLERTGETSGEGNARWKPSIEVVCSNCTNRFEIYPCRLKEKQRFFCDNDCRGEWQSNRFSGDNHPLYEDTTVESYGGEWSRVKGWIQKRDGDVCQLCGRGWEQVTRRPAVHHIVPVKSFDSPDEAHELDDLVQLCGHCHPRMEGLSAERQHELLERVQGGPYQ